MSRAALSFLLILATGVNGAGADDGTTTTEQDSPGGIDSAAETWDRLLPLIEEFSADYPVERKFATVTIGISHRGERRYWQIGEPVVAGDEAVPSEETIYQIGSITKTFTALLLADLIKEGVVSLDTTLGELIPDEIELAETTAGITLKDIATHTSGLPRIPLDLALVDVVVAGDNPYAAYNAERLWNALKTTTVAERSERTYGYSNMGVGLLGHLLAERLDTDYASLIESRIAEPLGLNDTVVELSESQLPRLAPGHSASGVACTIWTFDALAGAGALYSTTDDLLTYLEAHLHPGEHELAPAIELCRQTHYEHPDSGLKLGLGWHIVPGNGPHPIVFHNGGTNGYISFAGFIPETQTAVAILCNSGDALVNHDMVDVLGFQLLQASQTEATNSEDIAAQPSEEESTEAPCR